MKPHTTDKRTYVERIMTDVLHAGEHFVYSQDPVYAAREEYISAHHDFEKNIHVLCSREDRHGACVLLESYLSDLENREIAYKEWEIQGHHTTLQDDMHDDLEMLIENPSALRITREKIDARDHIMEAMHTTS